jgi:hypothetical protein
VVVQLVRIPACHAGGRGFESRPLRQTDRTSEGGYRVDAARLREAIEQEPAFQVDGKYSEQLALARLAQVGLTTERYRADVRRDLQNAELERSLVISDFATAVN